jgi:hypothetical protein
VTIELSGVDKRMRTRIRILKAFGLVVCGFASSAIAYQFGATALLYDTLACCGAVLAGVAMGHEQ